MSIENLARTIKANEKAAVAQRRHAEAAKGSEPVTLPRWAVMQARDDHLAWCPYCSAGRRDLCREETWHDEIAKALR